MSKGFLEKFRARQQTNYESEVWYHSSGTCTNKQ